MAVAVHVTRWQTVKRVAHLHLFKKIDLSHRYGVVCLRQAVFDEYFKLSYPFMATINIGVLMKQRCLLASPQRESLQRLKTIDFILQRR